MKKQTAVEWLMEQLKALAFDESHHLGMGDIRITQGQIETLERKAKAMEREQIIEAWDNGCEDDGIIDNAKQYYNETYKGGNNE